MITVKFYGNLKNFGKSFKLHAESPAEALRALMLQLEGLKSTLEAGQYKVRFNKETLSEDNIEEKFKQHCSGTLHITPVTSGAGKYTQIIK